MFVDLGIVPGVLKAKLSVNVDSLVGGGHEPLYRDILLLRDAARTNLIQPVGWATIHAQLVHVTLPIENDLVCRIAHAEVRAVGLGYKRNLDRRLEFSWCAQTI